jgi:hypothetical protein
MERTVAGKLLNDLKTHPFLLSALLQLTTDTIPHLDQLLRELARNPAPLPRQRQPADEVAELVDRRAEPKANRVGSEGSDGRHVYVSAAFP